jgi:hypothetical protein
MLRVLVIVVALCGLARAQDFSPEARKVTEPALARYENEIESRNFLLRINDMLNDSLITNVKHARAHLVEAKATFDKDPSLGHLEDVQTTAKRLQSSIDEYRSEAKSTMLKVGAGLALAVLVLFGGAIFAIIKRKARR